MIAIFKRLVLSATLILTAANMSAQAQSSQLHALNDAQSDQVKTIIRDYLLENPEIITEALTLLEERREQTEKAARSAAMTDLSDLIFNSERQVVMGNPEGDVTVVEFFDYNCGYCKRAHQDMVALLETDTNLRIVLKEFPVLGPGSVEAARVSIAVNALAPEKYEEFHLQTLLGPGQANGAKAMRIASTMGIDETAIQQHMDGSESAETIQEVYQIADALGLTGTPSYVIGSQVVFGAVGVEALRKAIATARSDDG